MVRSLLPLQGAWIGCLVEELTSGYLMQPSEGKKILEFLITQHKLQAANSILLKAFDVKAAR